MLAIAGTRPEVIKLAPVVKATGARIMLPGQHSLPMLMNLLDFFEIKRMVALDMCSHNGLSDLLAKMLCRIDNELVALRPSVVIVQGDTTSALAGALAAFHRNIPVAHVEAGLRTYDLSSPFPEEANRQLITKIATWHFCPSETASYNVIVNEFMGQQGVHVVGNTVVDALQWARGKLPEPADCSPFGYVLATVHRRENIDKIPQICDALNTLSLSHLVLATVHPNPQVQHAHRDNLCGRVHTFDAPKYPEFLRLINDSRIVLTDSGGVQEEAAALNKPCLVLRNNTERTEGIDAGCAKLVGTEPDKIVAACKSLLTDDSAWRSMAEAPNPYGDGKASERIAAVLREALCE